ncbi:hypothetical protein FRB94_002638 [Tulasnella sp. JGI-2019a]|nr:hypothetical protein FRB94_002638 [Tulasnella sp. JGI-2019a]
MEISQGVKRNKQDARDLARYVVDLTKATLRPLERVNVKQLIFRPEMEPAVNDFHGALQQVEKEMGRLASRNCWKMMVSYNADLWTIAAFEKRIENARRIMDTEIIMVMRALVEETNATTTKTLDVAENINATATKTLDTAESTQAVAKATYTRVVSVGDHLEDNKTRRLLERLGTGGSSPTDASAAEERICTPGTREAVLARIERWITGPEYDEKRILWLNALAGSGKTAIAGSVERMAKDAGRLGARFYFAHGQPDRNKRCILEISRQLAEHGLRDVIATAVEAEPDIITSAAPLQYQKLILEPLLTFIDTDLKLVIIIDALDECEKEYARKLLELIGRDHRRLPTGVKFFITSRAEPHIEGELEAKSVHPTVEELLLDEEEPCTVQRDIEVYLKTRFPSLVKEFRMENENWPGEETLVQLAQMAGKSFIWASTAFLLVADPNHRNPKARLKYILSTPTLNNLDKLYSEALNHAFPSSMDESVVSLVHDVLGTLVVARFPLTVTTLVKLLVSATDSSEEMEEIIRNSVLRSLGSVLTVTDDDEGSNSRPIEFLHKSFVDFLITKGRCNDRFLLDIPKQHENLAIRCLILLNRLERNICQLTDPSKLNSEVDNTKERLDRHIPGDLVYACKHWANHLSESARDRNVRTEREDGNRFAPGEVRGGGASILDRNDGSAP